MRNSRGGNLSEVRRLISKARQQGEILILVSQLRGSPETIFGAAGRQAEFGRPFRSQSADAWEKQKDSR